MGGSGGGGGSAGEVSWPSYVSDQYTGLLGDFAAVGNPTASVALKDAIDDNPWPDASAYFGDTEFTIMRAAYNQFRDRVELYDPPDWWATMFGPARQRYLEIIENQPYFNDTTPIAVEEILNYWILIDPTLTAVEEIDDYWKTPDPNSTEDIPANWTDPTFDAPADIKTDLADESEVNASVDAQRDIISEQLDADVLPRFHAGMRDINAVQSSAFVIGRAIIEGMGQRDVAKFDADLRYKAFLQRDNLLGQAHMQVDKLEALNTDSKNKAITQAYLDHDKILADNIESRNKIIAQAYLEKQKILSAEVSEENKLRSQALIQADKLNNDEAKAHNLINAEMVRHGTTLIYQDVDSLTKHSLTNLDMYKAWAGYVIDAERMIYVMNKEENDEQNTIDARAVRWDLDMVQIAGNLIASISGGTSYTPGPTPAQNALGGAFAGASIGARATGSAYGAGAGAILGGIGAYLLGR